MSLQNRLDIQIEPWPILELPDPPQNISHGHTCIHHSDCPAYHVCHNHQCIPQLLRGEKCENGNWIPYEYHGAIFAICQCTHPRLFTQKHFGGNCDVSTACGIHGKYDVIQNKCICDQGYKAGPNFTCQRQPITLCKDDPLQIHDGFHTDYIKKLSSIQCGVKRPCTYDALTGEPLKQGRYDQDWGCLCDPRYGLFGVKLNVGHLKHPGDDACVSILQKEPQRPLDDVEMYTYFYLKQRAPVYFTVFKNLNPDEISPLFKETLSKDGTLIVGGSWPYNYAQYVFAKERFAARRRLCYGSLFVTGCNEYDVVPNYKIPNCKDVEGFADYRNPRKITHYDILYKYPICHVPQDDEKANNIFKGRNILQPFLMTYDEVKHLYRTNGFVLKYEVNKKRWFLNTTEGYKYDLYAYLGSNAPRYDLRTVEDKVIIPPSRYTVGSSLYSQIF